MQRTLGPTEATARGSNAPGYWALVAAGEPFRLLFPLGAAIGIFGVLLWPLFIWNVGGVSYPGQFHARIMIEGFLTAFVFGFLGTAMPRLLDTPRLTIFETLALAAGVSGTAWLHFSGQMLWGDIVFFATMSSFVVALVVRFASRSDTPPPGFVLVALGILCALTGSALLIIPNVAPSALPGWTAFLGRLLLFQGYLLLPIMGIGAFLLPRFFQLPNRHSFPASLSLPTGWRPRAVFALACGAAVIASFVLEARGEIRWGAGLRAAAIAVYFAREVPFFRNSWGGSSTLALGVRIALSSVPIGYALMAIWPARVFSYLHVVFITGFSLLTLLVGIRVVLGHSGQSRLFSSPLWPVRILCALVVIAMITRVTADWMPDLRMSHYAYAAVAWIAGALTWAAFVLPSLRKPDTEE